MGSWRVKFWLTDGDEGAQYGAIYWKILEEMMGRAITKWKVIGTRKNMASRIRAG